MAGRIKFYFDENEYGTKKLFLKEFDAEGKSIGVAEFPAFRDSISLQASFGYYLAMLDSECDEREYSGQRVSDWFLELTDNAVYSAYDNLYDFLKCCRCDSDIATIEGMKFEVK